MPGSDVLNTAQTANPVQGPTGINLHAPPIFPFSLSANQDRLDFHSFISKNCFPWVWESSCEGLRSKSFGGG